MSGCGRVIDRRVANEKAPIWEMSVSVLARFEGSWSLERSIDDRLQGALWQFSGQAEFVRAELGLTYREHGHLRSAEGVSVAAERRYLWRETDAGIAVLHGDGQAFHHFCPVSGAMDAAHLCGEDLYHVSYDFADWPNWSAQWTALGPRKDYFLVSRYQRRGDLAPPAGLRQEPPSSG